MIRSEERNRVQHRRSTFDGEDCFLSIISGQLARVEDLEDIQARTHRVLELNLGSEEHYFTTKMYRVTHLLAD